MKRRRHWLTWVAAAYLVIIAVVSFGLIDLYTASRDRLDQGLGDRLLAVAVSLAATTDGGLVFSAAQGDSNAWLYLDFLAADFQQLSHDQNLAEITLTSPEGRVLFSSSPSLPAGAPNDFWELDRAAVAAAREGLPSATRLYRLQDTHQKSAHAAVMDYDPDFADSFVVGIITVSGNPDFFDSLDQLRRGALLTGAAVLLILVVVGFFLHRISGSFQQYQESLQRQENLAAMGRMTAGIAHEIRNPLGIIRGSGEHLAGVLQKAGIVDPVAEFIPEEVDRLDHILAGYLSFGTDGQGPMQAFDLHQCLRRSVRLIQPELEKDGVKIVLPGSVPEAMVYGDSLRLQQVILNLLINARDAMDSPGDIELGLAVAADQGVITVKDEGRGLGNLDREKLFEPFWTNKEKGSGLGLAMSRRIVEDMAGSLKLDDRTDCSGAVATIILPLLGLED